MLLKDYKPKRKETYLLWFENDILNTKLYDKNDENIIKMRNMEVMEININEGYTEVWVK